MNPQFLGFIESLVSILQLIVLVASVLALAKTAGQIVNKPNATQNQRLDNLEEWRIQVDSRLADGNDHFDQIDKGTRITQEALLALMQHAINGNDVEKLKKAKDKLESYLIEK